MLVNFNEIDGIIFDFDGTLYDFAKLPKNLIINRPFDIFKIKGDRDVRRDFKGIDFGNPEKFKEEYFKLLSKKTMSGVKTMEKWYYSTYRPHMCKVLKKYYKAYDGVNEVFEILKSKNIKTAILSDHTDMVGRLEAIGLSSNLCESIYSSEDFGALKPAQRPFLSIAKDFNIETSKILVIGDRDDTDGEGAMSCGMKFLRIASKRSRKEKPSVREEKAKLYDTLEWIDFYNLIKSL